MAPLPEENTNRLMVDYRVGGTDKHTLMVRFPDTTTKEEAATKMNDLLTELDDAFYTDTIFESARWAAKGQTFSFPVDWVPTNGAAAPAGRPADYRARFLSFVGRGEDARNWRVEFFGATLVPDNNFIITDAESPLLVSVREALLSDPNPAVTISGSTVVPLNYFTNRVSAYWQRKIAGGG